MMEGKMWMYQVGFATRPIAPIYPFSLAISKQPKIKADC
jgi:hypothetical protein